MRHPIVPQAPSQRPLPLPPILYEDDHILAFDKPSGLLVAPDRRAPEVPSVVERVHQCLSPEWFNVHRLDRETSGVILFAKTARVLQVLAGRFASRDVAKRYEAITQGIPVEAVGTIRLPMAGDPTRPGRMRTGSKGKSAETRFRVLTRWQGYTRLEISPQTGRRHQIRVHLAAIGCPVVGDSLYGSGQGLFLSALKPNYKRKRNEPERPLIGRLALHASALTFNHPIHDQMVTIHAPLPKDFRVLIKYLDRFAAISNESTPLDTERFPQGFHSSSCGTQ